MVRQTLRGILRAIQARWRVVMLVTAAVAVFNLALPPLVLSVVRKPVDFFTFNPWLKRLPEYLQSDQPLSNKLSFLGNMALAWMSADGEDGPIWGFIIDVPTLAKVFAMSLIFGTYFALWSYRRTIGDACGLDLKGARRAGMAGAAWSVFGLTTGPCTLAGCGVPVLPVLALAFTGLQSGTLTLFTTLSRVSIVVVLSAMLLAVLWFGFRAGAVVPREA
jgi:hypothetical protein